MEFEFSTHLHVFPSIGKGVGPGTSLYGRTFSIGFAIFALTVADVSAFSTIWACMCGHVLAVSICFDDCVVVAIRRTMQLPASRTFLTDFISNLGCYYPKKNGNCCNLRKKNEIKLFRLLANESNEYALNQRCVSTERIKYETIERGECVQTNASTFTFNSFNTKASHTHTYPL